MAKVKDFPMFPRKPMGKWGWTEHFRELSLHWLLQESTIGDITLQNNLDRITIV
jgi:hypothetical protein